MNRDKRMSPSRTIGWCLGFSLFVLGVYAAVSVALPRDSRALITFGDLVQCILPLFANAGLLLNAGTPHWRRNLFWMLFALSCTLWMIGQFEWTYYEVYLHKSVPEMAFGRPGRDGPQLPHRPDPAHPGQAARDRPAPLVQIRPDHRPGR